MKNATYTKITGLSKCQVIKSVKEHFSNCDILSIFYIHQHNALIVTEFDGISVTKWYINKFVDENREFNFTDKTILATL